MSLTDLPTLNAVLNGCTILILVLGFRAIKLKQEALHKKYMLLAMLLSSLFLVSYCIYHFNVGSVPFQGSGLIRIVYFLILIPHIVLASIQVPLILLAIYKALKDQRTAHRKIVRWTYPIWMYVSITGVVIYWMLYQMGYST